MTMLSSIHDRFSLSSAPALAPDAPAGAGGDGDALPFAGYDRLGDRQVIDGLCDHSQVELEAVDTYERSHKDRKPVLDKLRYMRGREPLPGYDAFSVEEIVTALEEADLATIKKVRGYERKFANRSQVLEAVVRTHHRRQATEPVSAAPTYQPISARTRSGASVDRPEGGDRP
jgi:hypothetical protein